MIEKLRERIFAWLLKRQASRKVTIPQWDKVRSVAILYPNDNIQHIIKQIEQANKEVVLFTLPDKKEICWLTERPKTEVHELISTRQFDVLIDLTQQPSRTLQYMAMYIRADFKVGRFMREGIYDLTFHKVTEKGNTYIVMDNKVGVLVDETMVQWIYSSVGDEGYYSYFKSGSCECGFCFVSFNNNSYLNKSEVKQVSLEYYQYSTPTITEVPTFTIPSLTIPTSLRTGNVPYYSCNHKECSDKLLNYLNITDSRFIISTQDINWNFSLIRDLGNDIYLVHYESGYNLPQDLQIAGITKPFAVIKVTKSNPYTVCDVDNAQDITIQVLSWDKYRDVAIAKSNFNSTTSFTYKPALKYSNDLCSNINGYVVRLFVTEKGKEGDDILLFILYSEVGIRGYQNLCYDKNKTDSINFSNEILTTVKGNWYPSLYRDNILIIDLISGNRTYNTVYPKYGYYSDYENTEIDFKDIRYELEYDSSKEYLNCKGLHIKQFDHGTGCEVSLKTVSQIDTFKFCKVYVKEGKKECRDLSLWYPWDSVPNNLQPKSCTPKYK